MTKTFAERCHIAQQFLPDAQYKAMLTALHTEMLAKLAEQPAQRNPLTDEEIRKAVNANKDYWASSKLFIIGIARAIEAARNIKENQS